MTAYILDVPDQIKILLKRIDNYTLNKQYGESNIPHLCIKVKHSNGFAWFGVHILDAPANTWSIEIRSEIQQNILTGLNTICDVDEIVTDMNRLMDSIYDIVSQRKRPAIYGGQSNELLVMNTDGNVQLDVYRELRNVDTLTYGGFEGEVCILNTWYPFFLYHRGIILSNYIDMHTAELVIEKALIKNFPEFFDEDDPNEFVIVERVLERTRNKRRDT